jgi:hypothetical protein
LFYVPSAFAWHHHNWSVETEATRRYIHGHIAAGLAKMKPEFSNFVTHPHMNTWRRLRYSASKMLRPGAERFGPMALRGWCWIHELNYQFAKGFLDSQQGLSLDPIHRPNYMGNDK